MAKKKPGGWTPPYRITGVAIPLETRAALEDLAETEGTTLSALLRAATVAAFGDRDPRIAAMADARGTAAVVDHLKEKQP